MKFLIVLAALVAYCAAAPHDDSNAEVVRSSYEQEPEGPYKVVYETANGIVSHSEGVLKSVDKDTPPAVVVKGAYSYVDADNNKYDVTYEADENGFKAYGAHLPTPPPVPVYIEKSLQYIKEHPYTEKN